MKRLVAGAALAVAIVVGPAIPAAASGGGGCGQPVTDAAGTTVSIKDFCFQPTVLRVEAGSVVTFTNRDPFQHDVIGANGAWGSWLSLGKVRDSLSYRFSAPGVYSYACTWHPGMTGTVVVAGEGPTDPTSVRMTRDRAAQAEPAAEAIAAEPVKLERETFSPETEDWFLVAGFGAAWLAIVALLRRRTT